MTNASKGATTRKPKSKGRQRIAIAFIVNKARRHVTFSKRKAGLLNKARELALRYDAHVAVILFSAAGKAFTFGSPSVDSVLRRLAPLPGEDAGAAAPEPAEQTRVPYATVDGMAFNAMDSANGYVYQQPCLAANHYYQYFTDGMGGFQMQAPGSNANAHDDDVWRNLCGIDNDWSCDAVVPAEYRSMDVAAGSSSYKPAGDDDFTGVPAIGQGCNFVGEDSYDYETQCLLDGDLHCPDATSNFYGLDEQLNCLSDLAEGFVF